MKTKLSFSYIQAIIGKSQLSLKTSNFIYIEKEYPQLAHIVQVAEVNVFIDPPTTLTKLRLLLELLSKLISKYEGLGLDRIDQLTRLQKLEFEDILPSDILELFHKVRISGNKASQYLSLGNDKFL